jgi:hypothetical protein
MPDNHLGYLLENFEDGNIEKLRQKLEPLMPRPKIPLELVMICKEYLKLVISILSSDLNVCSKLAPQLAWAMRVCSWIEEIYQMYDCQTSIDDFLLIEKLKIQLVKRLSEISDLEKSDKIWIP